MICKGLNDPTSRARFDSFWRKDGQTLTKLGMLTCLMILAYSVFASHAWRVECVRSRTLPYPPIYAPFFGR
jgi:hypothetical protein